MEENKHKGQDLGLFKPLSLGPRILHSAQELHHRNSIYLWKKRMKEGWVICCKVLKTWSEDFTLYLPCKLWELWACLLIRQSGVIILAWFHSILKWIEWIRGSTIDIRATKKCKHHFPKYQEPWSCNPTSGHAFGNSHDSKRYVYPSVHGTMNDIEDMEAT